MKKKDILIVIIIAFISAILSYLLASMIFGGENKYTLTAPVVQPISSDFNTPPADDPYLNKSSINPTINISIGDSTNDQPFNQGN